MPGINTSSTIDVGRDLADVHERVVAVDGGVHVVAFVPERARDGVAYVFVVFDDEYPAAHHRWLPAPASGASYRLTSISRRAAAGLGTAVRGTRRLGNAYGGEPDEDGTHGERDDARCGRFRVGSGA